MRSAASLVAPPRCGICRAPCAAPAPACERCVRALELSRRGGRILPSVGLVVWSATHAGVARRLVSALKFEGRMALADLAAARIASVLPAQLEAEALVAVPPAAARLRRRGFDPTALLAGSLADRIGVPSVDCLTRLDSGRQVGRSRAARLADPPRVAIRGAPPGRALLVDDVFTTGASLRACAAALRDDGCAPAGAAVFAAALGPEGGGA